LGREIRRRSAARRDVSAPMSKEPARIAGMFDAIAARYDLLNHLLSAGLDLRWRRRAIEALALTGVERILDLCTGTADLAIAARRATPAASRVIGIDFSAEMLRIGRQKIAGCVVGGVSLVRADATQIPLAGRSVDGATIAFGIRNVDRPEDALREIRRVLRPGGRIVILEFAIPSNPAVRPIYLAYFKYVLPQLGRLISRHGGAYEYLPASVGAFPSPDEFASTLRRHGFRNVRSVPLTLGAVYLYAAETTVG
jgi:demethylmenaquinone methyltransferase/2-methoxy-6-polyprenyl-1,4-benzoquinol methylase